MVIDVGEKVHVIERRRFDGDIRRHVCGVVDRSDDTAVRITGYEFIYDSGLSGYIRGQRARTRTVPLGAAGYVVNVIPPDTVIESVRYESDESGRLRVTDGDSFNLDINEFGRLR